MEGRVRVVNVGYGVLWKSNEDRPQMGWLGVCYEQGIESPSASTSIIKCVLMQSCLSFKYLLDT